MEELCRGCERKDQDFGGCRCQAFMFTKDANAADPVCSRASARSRIDQELVLATGASEESSWTYRGFEKFK
jgi:pyrroloquinoline quinone biosynthesis protein E